MFCAGRSSQRKTFGKYSACFTSAASSSCEFAPQDTQYINHRFISGTGETFCQILSGGLTAINYELEHVRHR